MLCEIRNSNLLYNGEFFKVGDIKEIADDNEIIKLRPDIIFPVSEGNRLDNEVKVRNSKLLKSNKDLEEENVRLLYTVKQLEAKNIELAKKLSEAISMNKIVEDTEAKEQLKRKYNKRN